MTNYQMALAGLRGCQAQLRAAHADAHSALRHLTGARGARAAELADKAADALAHCERLIFIVTGDLRADELGALQ
jgi:Arc/MetJ family transcription regulator